MEFEVLPSTAVRLGRAHGVPTPCMGVAYAILQPWERRNALPPADRAAIP